MRVILARYIGKVDFSPVTLSTSSDTHECRLLSLCWSRVVLSLTPSGQKQHIDAIVYGHQLVVYQCPTQFGVPVFKLRPYRSFGCNHDQFVTSTEYRPDYRKYLSPEILYIPYK